LVRQLQEDAGSVARLGVVAFGTAMGQVLEQVDALSDNLVRRHPAQVGDEA
jgi:hypothetical protein